MLCRSAQVQDGVALQRLDRGNAQVISHILAQSAALHTYHKKVDKGAALPGAASLQFVCYGCAFVGTERSAFRTPQEEREGLYL